MRLPRAAARPLEHPADMAQLLWVSSLLDHQLHVAWLVVRTSACYVRPRCLQQPLPNTALHSCAGNTLKRPRWICHATTLRTLA